MILNVTKENFDKEVLQAEGTVLVDFWASWCGPCRMIAPAVEKISEEHPDVKVCKVNGEVVNTAVGLRPKEEIEELL